MEAFAPSAHAATHQTLRVNTRPVALLSSAVPAVRDTLTYQLPDSAAEIAYQLFVTTKASSTHQDRHGPTQVKEDVFNLGIIYSTRFRLILFFTEINHRRLATVIANLHL